MAAVTIDTPGYCYLVLFRKEHRAKAFALLGKYPLAADVLYHQPLFHPQWRSHNITLTGGVAHVHKEGGFKSTTFSARRQKWLSTGRFEMGAAMLGRLFPSTLSLFPLPKEAGTVTADNYDSQFSNTINTVFNSLTRLPIVRVPINLPQGAAKALFSLFGRYQIDQSGGSSTHPHLDSFRRLCDNVVFDTYRAENIVEIGSSLTRMARFPTMCAAHTCSPNIDGRDRSRAVIAASIASANPNHPYQAELVARGNLQWNNPAWMCNNRGQFCDVPGRVLYASFSLQDCEPSTLEMMMNAHNSSIALVSLQLPVPLLFVDRFQEADTGCRWEKDEAKDIATCYPGFGDAGYVHKWSTLKTWINGFQNNALYAEILYQYGSATLLRFSRNGNEQGTQSYPILMKTMMEKYAFIEGDANGIPNFLTSASHYDRLVAYLTTHHDKFAHNLMKAALERISVLTPAIVLGDDKYADRWVLDTDQRLSVAFSAVVDVQKMMHRTTLAQRRLEHINSELATSSRRAEAALEPAYADRLLAWMRGETSITSTRTVGDWIADTLDYRNGRSLAQTTHLPDSITIENGTNRPGPLGAVIPPAAPPPAQPAAPAGGRYVPRRLGYPGIGNWHPGNDEAWLQQQNGLPAPRDARLLNAFDPAVNQQNAVNNLNGLPLNNLRMLQDRAVGNWDWEMDTRIDLAIFGPPGTGKSTHARRIAPAGSCVVVPTNELQQHWQAVYPGHAVFTLDEAVANIVMLRAATCIIIDEVFQFPIGHVITLASQHIPVIALGCPAQRRYNGPLGAPFSPFEVPIDRHVICRTIQRFGQDLTDLANRAILPVYQQYFAAAGMAPFLCANPGVRNIQDNLVNRPNAMHLTFHRANTNIYNGCITIDASQGTDANDVYVHVFPQDHVAFGQNAYALPLAWSRSRLTVTFTVPAGTRANAPIVQYLIAQGIPNARIMRRIVGPGGQVFGSRFAAVNHGFTSLDDLEHELPGVPYESSGDMIPTQQQWMGREIVNDCDEDEAPLECVISPALKEALYAVQPEPPSPADLHRDKSMIRFVKPDPNVRIRVPEWIATAEFNEPTIYHHIGYPFTNSEVLASIVAVFDRYTKPQNVAIPNARAHQLADIMFDRWMLSFIRPEAQVTMPTTAAMFSQWFSNAKALRLAQIAEQLPFADSSRPLRNEYFLKCQCKAKFKAFGFCAECGQGILATNKLLNATVCPLIVAATKECQARLKPNVVYDSGYTAEELDEAVRASGALECTRHLSSDLSQQDSSHTNVHRFFIAKVMTFLGFNDTIVTLYLISRARRFCSGLTILGLMFEVIERLFSGEPGTAFFNWLMSGGTAACTLDLVTRPPRLMIGKGDDFSVSPAVPKLKMAINMVKETGVKLKLEEFSYLDFANRIFTTSGRSFADPVRMLAKYTMRMSKRENTENEWMAYRDQRFICTPGQFEEIVRATEEKHGLDYWTCHDILEAAIALHDKNKYYGSLRPSKVPVPYMTVVRKSGQDDVVFEDLQDKCAPAAIAFIADVPVEEVISYVVRIRLQRDAHPDVRSANRESRHPSPFFMDDYEIRKACTKFGVRLAGSELSLKPEGGHVVVVRKKLSWRTLRYGKADRVFGSVGATINIGCGVFMVCLLLFVWSKIVEFQAWLIREFDLATYRVTQCWDAFFFLMSPSACLTSLLPGAVLLHLGYWSWALRVTVAIQIACRLFLLPFYYRSLKPMKRPATIRVEHAVYGSTSQGRSYVIDRLLLTIALVVFAVFSIWADLNVIEIAMDLRGEAFGPMGNSMLFIWSLFIESSGRSYRLVYGCSSWFMLGHFTRRGWLNKKALAVCSMFLWLSTPLDRCIHLCVFLFAWLAPERTVKYWAVDVWRERHSMLLIFGLAFWIHRGRVVEEFFFPRHGAWQPGVGQQQQAPRQPWWRRFYPQSERSKEHSPQWKLAFECLKYAGRRGTKQFREFMRNCHPDKLKGRLTDECLAAIETSIGQGTQRLPPAECQ